MGHPRGGSTREVESSLTQIDYSDVIARCTTVHSLATGGNSKELVITVQHEGGLRPDVLPGRSVTRLQRQPQQGTGVKRVFVMGVSRQDEPMIKRLRPCSSLSPAPADCLATVDRFDDSASLSVANSVYQNKSIIRLASSLPSRCAAAFKLAMCCDNTATLAGADAGLAVADFTLAGAGFFLAGFAADGFGVELVAAEPTAAEPDACLSLVLTEVTSLPVILTPFSSLICWAMAVGPFSGYLAR